MITQDTAAPFRVVTIGEESVGKTSITQCLISKKFNPYEPGTIGANYQQYTETVDDKPVEIQIWDTAGQEKFRSLAPIYFRNASAAVCVFSLTSESSFTDMQLWINSFTEIADSSALIYIAANKCDLTDEFQVTFEDAREWAQKEGRKIFKTSAKTGAGVSELFKELAAELCKVKASKVQTHGLQSSTSGSCC